VGSNPTPSARSPSTAVQHCPTSSPEAPISSAFPDRLALDMSPGGKPGKPLSNMAMLALIERMNERRAAAGQPRWVDPMMGSRDIVPHGFRSTFRDWAAERTNFPNEMVEMALAHAVDDKVEAAYRRGDLFDKRRRLMDAWAEFCGKPGASDRGVIPLRAS
jgi:integrase